MYEVIKKVIESKRFELSDVLKKIDTLWAQGSITDDQKGRLVQLAREYADAQASIDVMAKLEELDRRIAVLEKGNVNTPAEGEEESVADYVPGKYYYNGAKVAHNGVTYVCIAPDGVVCVWSPSEYPAYWELA